MIADVFAGSGALIRLILRRERIALPLWIVGTAGLGLGAASSFAKLYHTTQELQTYATETAGSPAVAALLGPVFAPTLGGLVAWRWTIQGMFVIALMSVLMVVRHTRGDEEAGRRELLGATVVGRHAPLTAALVVTFGANLLMATVAAAGFIALGLPTAGALALPLSVAALGCVLAAVAGIAAQVTESAGAARGIAGAVFGVLYLVRAVGDAGGEHSPLGWLSWISPFDWGRFTRPFADERWWIFLLYAGTVACLVAIAYALSARRDLGAGLFAPRHGPADAAPGLRSPLALAMRLQKGALVAWTASFAVIGTAFGFVATSVSSLLTTNQQLMPFFTRIGGGASPSDVIFFLYFLTFGPIIALYAIVVAQRMRSEETQMRVDPLLATPTSRVQWAASHLVFAVMGPVLILTVLGVTAGLTYGLSVGQVEYQLARVLTASLAYLPAIWVIGGIAAVQFGLLPRAGYLNWTLWLLFALVDFLANELRQIDVGYFQISPFAYVPKTLLGAPVSPTSAFMLVAIALALLTIGLIGFRQRDLKT